MSYRPRKRIRLGGVLVIRGGLVLAVVVGGWGSMVLKVVDGGVGGGAAAAHSVARVGISGSGDGVGIGAASAHFTPRLSLIVDNDDSGDGVGLGAASAQSTPWLSLVRLLWLGVVINNGVVVGVAGMVICDSSVADSIAALKTSLRSRGCVWWRCSCGRSLLVWWHCGMKSALLLSGESVALLSSSLLLKSSFFHPWCRRQCWRTHACLLLFVQGDDCFCGDCCGLRRLYWPRKIE